MRTSSHKCASFPKFVVAFFRSQAIDNMNLAYACGESSYSPNTTISAAATQATRIHVTKSSYRLIDMLFSTEAMRQLALIST